MNPTKSVYTKRSTAIGNPRSTWERKTDFQNQIRISITRTSPIPDIPFRLSFHPMTIILIIIAVISLLNDHFFKFVTSTCGWRACLKKGGISTISGSREPRSLEITCPAIQKSRSRIVDEGSIPSRACLGCLICETRFTRSAPNWHVFCPESNLTKSEGICQT